MDIEAHRDLQLLEAVEQNARVTQRTLATKLGIALGLTNIYLKRLVRKGYIKCVNVQSNRITYLLTPAVLRRSCVSPTSSWIIRCTCTVKCGSTSALLFVNAQPPTGAWPSSAAAKRRSCPT